MAQALIDKDDIRNSFLVTKMYKETGDWPHETIAACKIICTDKNGGKWVSHQIYKNSFRHAEKKLIEYLRWLGNALEAGKIIINIYMNYSPCNKCARKILKYIKEMNSPNSEIEMTITFANFYQTHVYTEIDIDIASANIEGLKKLKEHKAMKLRLLGVHVKWERFLDMSEFFSLTEEEKDECLDEACSNERQRREIQDQMVWDKIFNDGVGVITSGLNSDLLVAMGNLSVSCKENIFGRKT